MARLAEVLPTEEQSRIEFFTSWEALPVIEKFAQKETWQNYSIFEFRDLHTQNHESLAIRYHAYFQAIETPEIFHWLSDDRLTAAIFVNGFSQGKNYAYFLHHPQRTQLMQTLDWQTTIEVVNKFGIRLAIDKPDLYWELRDIDTKDWDWSSRLEKLAEVLHVSGYLGVDDSLLTQTVTSAYKKDLSRRLAKIKDISDLERRTLSDEVIRVKDGLSGGFGSTAELLASIRSSQTGDIDMLRQSLLKAGSGKVLPDYLEHYQRHLKSRELDWRENILNPLSHLKATNGFEIEFIRPENIPEELYSVLDILGFKKGGGGAGVFELSPGPFVDYRTAQETFAIFVRAGLIDLYSHFGQSVHFNIGVQSPDGSNALMRLLQLTGWASMPAFAGSQLTHSFLQKEDSWHQLRIFFNDQHGGHGRYLECKEFDLVTPSSFFRFLRAGSLLGTALHNFQLAYNAKYPVQTTYQRRPEFSWPTVTVEQPVDKFHLRPHQEFVTAVETARINKYSRRLGKIWLEYYDFLEAGLKRIGLNSFLLPRVPTVVASRTVKEIQAVYPTSWSRMEVKPSQVETLPFDYLGRRYANPVHFVQQTTISACRQVEIVLATAEDEFVRRLDSLIKQGFDESKTLDLLKDYPCGIWRQSSHEYKCEQLLEIRQHYGSVVN
jgi:hypothetical protein